MTRLQLGRLSRIGGFLIVTSLGMSLAVQRPATAAKEKDKSSDSIDAASVNKKLDQILSDQKTILQQLDVVREELRVIKIRASH